VLSNIYTGLLISDSGLVELCLVAERVFFEHL